MDTKFQWIPFYEELADKLLEYKDKRQELFSIIKNLASKTTFMDFLKLDRKEQWESRNNEIDPFSVFAIFNRGIKDNNRITIANLFKEALCISADLPQVFIGIPLKHKLKSIYGGNDEVWGLFVEAMQYAQSGQASEKFNEYFASAINAHNNGLPSITIGLFWIRPNIFLNLDGLNTSFIKNTNNNLDALSEKLPYLENSKPNGMQYLELCKICKDLLKTNIYPFSTFPEMSEYVYIYQTTQKSSLENDFKKWFEKLIKPDDTLYSQSTIDAYCLALKNATTELDNAEGFEYTNLFSYKDLHIFQNIYKQIRQANNYEEVNKKYSNQAYHAGLKKYMEFLEERNVILSPETSSTEVPAELYTTDNFLQDVYISEEQYNKIMRVLERKKNIILQGAPGVGKTYIAKRLAYSLMGKKDEKRVKMVQFHQSYSYEDFIIGYKPNNTGFSLQEGEFYKFRNLAIDNTHQKYYFIIDEINRGNLSKIFGEVFMLLEADKRKPEDAIRLLYNHDENRDDFYIPDNLYIIGTMNTADRSLAMLDYALRRRFAFINIEPAFESKQFKNYKEQINNEQFDKLIENIKDLNNEIKKDENLGEGFQIGHSYFITDKIQDINDEYIKDLIQYEILPLLEEYWFDDPSTVKSWNDKLMSIFNE